MHFRSQTIFSLSDMICGNFKDDESFFVYRSSSKLTHFFKDCGTNYQHDGSTRVKWVAEVLEKILLEPQPNQFTPPKTFAYVINVLMDQDDATNESKERINALKILNKTLKKEGYEAFYAEEAGELKCCLRNIKTNTIARNQENPHRPFSQHEIRQREKLATYLNTSSEDELIENILLPLFRQLGFHRITATGHKDKSLEYVKDIWMKYTLPTQHILYFGIQVKKGKLDASANSHPKSVNIAEIYNQVLMMLGHEIFDHDINKHVLVDHAYIISSGEITKAAKNWLGNRLNSTKRSQIIFMDRDDLLNLFIVTNLPLPNEQHLTTNNIDNWLPFNNDSKLPF